MSVFLDRARWVTDKYILLMLGLFPLFWGFEGYSNITASKFYFFAAATCLWAVAVLILLAIGGFRGERYSLTVRPAHAAMAMFLAFGAVSACLSDYGVKCLMGVRRYDGYATTLMYAAIFFGVSWLAVPRRRYAWALGFSAAVCCAVAYIQLMGFDPFGLYPDGTNYYDGHVAYNSAFLGTIGNTGLLAAYLCLAAPLLTAFALLSEKGRDRLLLIPGLMALGILLLCDVDAGLVALSGCVLVGVPMVLRGHAGRTAACVSGGIAAAGLGTLYFWPWQSGLPYQLSQVLHGNLADEFGSHRGEIWKRGWELFREKPWFGGGPGTAGDRLNIHWSRFIEEANRTNSVTVTNTHNVYLGYLVNMGIFAALSYVAAAVCSFVTWFRRREKGALYPALGCGILCFMLQDFFGLGLSLTEPMLFVAWGLLESTESME